ncbi:TolC family protein [uncultured Stenotrophomonas sp.]|uniref:TolC family protein n=1 Tax=uncultured Stenotrophomonas sp. TaxID=165438 RepID=UPI0025D65D0A|nr:TolC family protein [uncultured Stenotrophomonas sp.]
MTMMTRLPFPAPSRLLLAGAVLLALSACASVGRYPVQDPDVAASYGRGDATLNAPADDPRSSLDTPGRDIRQDTWWTGFGDERLDRLVARALAANSDLAAAGLAVQRSRLQAGLASNALWPQPSSSGVSGNASRATDQADDWRRSYSTGVSLGWEVDLWGRLRTQRDIARWEAQASEEDRQNTALLVISDTITQYWNLAYLNQSIATGQANLERLERTRELVQARFDAGAVSRLEVRQAQQNLQSQRSSQSALEQQRVEVRNALTVLLDGTPWPQQDEPQDLLGAHSPGISEGLPADLLGRRPDLRAAELRLRNSLKTIKVTATQYYPALSLTGSLGSSATSLGDVLRNPVATLGAGLSLPFLNLQRAQLDTDIAGTAYQIAATNFRKTLYTALSEVDNALSAREQLARQVAASQASYDEAVEVERAQEVRYRVGATDLRTWLEAQQTRRDAELSLARVRQGQLNNDVTLFKALGGSAG